MKNLIYLSILVFSVSACVTRGPALESDFSSAAESAVAQAEANGAMQHSPLELRFVKEKLAAAIQANADGDPERARRLARQVEVDAELCLAKTNAAIARDAASQQRAANERLQVELETQQ